jgi:hypothetical protein
MASERQDSRDVLIVAANKWAYYCFWNYSAYICQAGRSFRQDVDRIGYYVNREIRPEFPLILARRDHVPFNYETARKLRLLGNPYDMAFAEIIERSKREGRDDIPGQVFLLSGQTIRLPFGLRSRSKIRSGAVPAARLRGRKGTAMFVRAHSSRIRKLLVNFRARL